MDIRKPKTLKQAARQRLGNASADPRMLVLLHTAVALGAGLLVSVINFLLTRSIDAAGGLAGLQTRSVLETVQSVLDMASSLLLPFWQIGLIRAAIAFAREEKATPTTLLEGFRRFGPVLRLMLLRLIVIWGVVMACVYVGTLIFLATPLSQPVTELLTPILSDATILSDPNAMLDEATLATLTDTVLLPLIPILMLLMAVLALPLLYRLRLCDYLILDGQSCRAREAFAKSLRLTRHNAFSLFRIDLSFWWFYGLQLLCIAVGYADAICAQLQISLPISGDSAFFVCYILSLFLQLALYWRFGAYVQTTQALAYETLNSAEPTQPQPAAQTQPWNY